MASRRNLKRKSPEEDGDGFVFPLDELNQDLLEKVLSWLPSSTFLRLTSVSKRWKSAATSSTFHLACSQIPSRDPWFYMVDSSSLSSPFVYDSSEMNWKKLLTYPSNFLEKNQKNDSNFLPVAASGGLLCFHNSEKNEFLIFNPVNSSCRKLPLVDYCNTLCAIGMISTQESYRLFLVFGEFPTLSFRVYDSVTNLWGESAIMSRKFSSCPAAESYSTDDEEDDDGRMLYFLGKCGNVVATEIQKTPCKQYSSIITKNGCNGQEILYFLNSNGKVVVCNFAEKYFFEYPRLLPLSHEYSIDLVEYGGELLVVVLSEFLETASLRVWKFDEKSWIWNQGLAMPVAISHEFYGKKVDINCTGGDGEKMFVCISNAADESCRYFLCNLVGNEWTELPACSVDGYNRKFSCAFSFQPRIEASV
ncbi:F-box only protein 13-like [Nicotiana tabacum]|uniref:F-box only protein 13-like n=1 Tax=Nicotiana tabacum TaxID=4097 RepID=A0A1S4DG94_TOBAC|nr:PREDICTED: F-box only protein 13-like [Nicotiana tabacum]